jgi:hypothetical protein
MQAVPSPSPLPKGAWGEFTTFVGDHPILTIFGAICLIAVIGAALNQPTTSASPPKTAEEKKTEEENNAALAMAAVGAESIRKAMRDPDSFKLNSVLIIDKTRAVCCEYRARNGFNGLNVGHAVLSTKGKLVTDEMDGFRPLWNRECAHKEGHEWEPSVSILMK